MMECLIITGCTRGLGFELHRILALDDDGQRCCVFLGRNLRRLEKNPKFIYLETDFTQEYMGKELLDSLPKNLTRVTVISNAGMVSPIVQVEHLPINVFTDAVKVNFTAPAALISSLALWAKENQALLRVLNVSSGAANSAIPGWATYCSTKAGFKMFLDVLSAEQSTTEVIHFDPGVMNTDMQKEIRASNLESMPDVDIFIEYEKNNRLNIPEDVAIQIMEMLKVYV